MTTTGIILPSHKFDPALLLRPLPRCTFNSSLSDSESSETWSKSRFSAGTMGLGGVASAAAAAVVAAAAAAAVAAVFSITCGTSAVC